MHDNAKSSVLKVKSWSFHMRHVTTRISRQHYAYKFINTVTLVKIYNEIFSVVHIITIAIFLHFKSTYKIAEFYNKAPQTTN